MQQLKNLTNTKRTWTCSFCIITLKPICKVCCNILDNLKTTCPGSLRLYVDKKFIDIHVVSCWQTCIYIYMSISRDSVPRHCDIFLVDMKWFNEVCLRNLEHLKCKSTKTTSCFIPGVHTSFRTQASSISRNAKLQRLQTAILCQ